MGDLCVCRGAIQPKSAAGQMPFSCMQLLSKKVALGVLYWAISHVERIAIRVMSVAGNGHGDAVEHV